MPRIIGAFQLIAVPIARFGIKCRALVSFDAAAQLAAVRLEVGRGRLFGNFAVHGVLLVPTGS
jgi:hypothetical protein